MVEPQYPHEGLSGATAAPQLGQLKAATLLSFGASISGSQKSADT